MTTQLPLITPDPPDVSRGTWHAFTGDHDPDDARTIYQQHYGQPPQHIVTVAGRIPQLRLGPIITALLVLIILAAYMPSAPCPLISVNARRGDTVATIAGRYGTSSAAIRAANPGHDLDPLIAGQTITVPACRLATPRWPSQLTGPRR